MSPTGRAAAAPGRRYLAEPTQSFWKSLRYLSDARFIVAGLLLAYVPLLGREAALQQGFERVLFLGAAGSYFALAVFCSVAVRVMRRGFHLQLLAQVLLDIAIIGLIVYAAGGARSGLGVLMITPTAGAAILSTPLLSMAIAAAASLVLLSESAWRALQADAAAPGGLVGSGDLVIAGVISAVLFFTAVIVNRLARRLSAQESLADRRGEDLRNQLAINELVIAELDQGVVVFDRRGALKGMNPKARLMLDLPPGLPAGQVDPTALATLRALIAGDQLATDLSIGGPGERKLKFRARVLTGGGRFEAPARAADSSSDPVAGPADGVGSLVDRVVLLEDLEHIEERAQQLKLASMGRLSASIAHEIRNPLGAIRHAGNLLAEQVPPGPLRRMTTIIEENSLRIDRIVEDVLSIARRTATRESVPLPEFFNGFLPEFVVQTDTSWERIVLELDCPDSPLFDPNHLRQVLVNLLSNALRYASDTPGAIRVSWRQTGERQAVLRVVDDGPGVAPADRENLFEPFFTTEARGTGLGLHMAQELCAANGADLRYESAGDRHGGAFVIEPELAPRRGAGPVSHRDTSRRDSAWQQKQTA